MKIIKTINIAGVEREYISQRYAKARQVKLSVYPDGRINLSRPYWVSQARAERFLQAKLPWLTEKLCDIPVASKASGKNEYKQNKQAAERLVLLKLDYFNRYYHFPFRRVSIRNQRTRWGSCSKDKNLNFNYRIVSLPEDLADYIIVHELCHLKELNHSSRFWALVAQTVPDFKERRRRLKKMKMGIF